MASPGKYVSREAPQPPSGLEGYLSKQGGGSSVLGRKNWKVRYFVLKNGVLSYFTDKKEAQASATPKGSFHVLSITSIKTMPHKDSKFHNQCHREIVLPNRSLVVCCDQEDILKKWVDAINGHIRYERKTEHLKKIQIEAQMVEEEMSQQMCFTIMFNVLKRWLAIEFQRSLQAWRMNMLVARYGEGPASDMDSVRLRKQFDAEKKDEMRRFTEAVKEKWEDAVVSLKEEMQALKDVNAKLREDNNALLVSAGNSPLPSPEASSGDTVEVLRHEFVALMEAAALGQELEMMEGGGGGMVVQELKAQITAQEADLTLQRSIAATAQEQAQIQAARADSLAERLEAAETALKKVSAEVEILKGTTAELKGSSVSPMERPPPPLPSPPPARVSAEYSNSMSPKGDSSSWIARYKAIVNSPL